MSKRELDKPESDVFENSLNTRPEEQLHYSHESFLKRRSWSKLIQQEKFPLLRGCYLWSNPMAQREKELDISISTHLLRS
jgi:hypothetical protein